MKKGKTIYINQCSLIEYIQPYIDAGIEFSVEKTGYSSKIIFPDRNIFISQSRNTRALFHIASKIKSEIDKAPEVDLIKREDVSYHDLNSKIQGENLLIGDCYNVDISSAYVTALYINSIISKDLFDEVLNLEKIDRLKSLGMIATRKTFYEFGEGRLLDYRLDDSEKTERRRKYFFLACKIVGDLMAEIARACGDKFLFYWVDGVYLRNSKSKAKAEKIIQKAGFDFKSKKLYSFEIESRETSSLISFYEDSNRSDDSYKEFRLPIQIKDGVTDTAFRRLMEEKDVRFLSGF